MQRIPHDATKYRNNPVELMNIANRQRIGWLLDPYTKLLIPGNGTNGSTTITDLTGKTVTVSGNTNISTAQSIIGGSSIYFDGTGDYLSLADSADWDFGTGAFTIDFWMRYSSKASAETILGIVQDENNVLLVRFPSDSNNFNLLVVTGGSATLNFSVLHSMIADTWYHIAVVRGWASGTNNFAITVNGSSIGSTTTSLTVPNYSGSLYIGQDVGNNNAAFHGYLSYIRISKDIARWTSNFTPPSKLSDYCQMNNYIGA